MVALIARVCARLDVDGLRADIVCAKTAVALAALDAAGEVAEQHVRRAALLALAHRRRRGPLEQPGLDEQELDRALADAPPDDEPPPGGPRPGRTGRPSTAGRAREDAGPAPEPGAAATPPAAGRDPRDEARFDRAAPAPDRTDDPLTGFRAAPLATRRQSAGAPGRRAPARVDTGRPVAERPHEPGATIALLPALMAAAPHQRARERRGRGLALERADLRSFVLEDRAGALVVFVVDASGSMAARRRMAAVKGAVLALLVDAYERRDLVALIAARGEGAELVLPPTASVEVAARRLRELRAGGRTPLGAGLDRARELVRTQRLRGERRQPLVLLVTDGRANAGDADPADAACRAATALRREGASFAIIDSEQGPVRLGLAAALAVAAGGAPVVPLDALAPEARRAA